MEHRRRPQPHPDYYRIPIADREALIAEERAHGNDREALIAEERAHGNSADEEPADNGARAKPAVRGGPDRLEEQANGAQAESDDDPESDDPESDDPESDDPESDDPESDDPESDDPDFGPDAAEIAAKPLDVDGELEEVAEDAAVDTVGGDEVEEDARRRARLLRRYKIQEVIKRRQVILVQVSKEERGTKGAALTTYLSLAGRYCVLMPNTARGGGISRKIASPSDRRRLKKILGELDMPEGVAVIVRTAGSERSKAEIRRDYEYLLRLWSEIREDTLKSTAPSMIYEEGNLIKRAIRDLYSSDMDEVLVEGEAGHKDVKNFMKSLIPSHAKKVLLYKDSTVPLFNRHQVETQLDAMHSPTVQLRSGGYVVINSTEALVAIDVNSGKATKERHIEETALKTNLEAAEEVARQLRLRDLAGLIVIDFIDMEESRHNRDVERMLKDAMRHDRARIQLGRIGPFGLLELSRQRLRPSLQESSTEVCNQCGGNGYVRSTDSTALHVLRALEEEGVRRPGGQVVLSVPTPVALYILNQKRERLVGIEQRYDYSLRVEADDALRPPAYDLRRIGGSLEEKAEVEVAAEATGSEDGRRPRKRRRRRKGEGAEGEVRTSDEARAPGEVRAASEVRDSGEAARPFAAPADAEAPVVRPASAEDDEDDRQKPRRRRGKRGGRRRTRQLDEAAPGTPESDTPESDTPESGTPESGTPESGTPESGTPESGTPESGTPESGTPESGTPEFGTPESGTPESGTLQTGVDGDGLAASEAATAEPIPPVGASDSDAQPDAKQPREEKPARRRPARRRSSAAQEPKAESGEDSAPRAAQRRPRNRRRPVEQRPDVEAAAPADAALAAAPPSMSEPSRSEPSRSESSRSESGQIEARELTAGPNFELTAGPTSEPTPLRSADAEDDDKPKRRGWWQRWM